MKYPPMFSFFSWAGKKCLTLCCFAFIIIFSSCKKDGKPASELIVGKWNLTSQYNYIHVGGQTSTQPLTTPPGSYFDFNSNGSVMIKLGDSEETAYSYSFKSDKEVLFTKPEFPSKLLTVLSVNASKLTLAERTVASGNDYTEARMEFSK